VGVVLVTAMFLSFVLLVGRVTMGTGLILAFAVCSPAVMFAVERANMDIALFSVISLALLLWRTFPRPAAVVSPMLVLVGAVAKLYPIFALPAFVVASSRTAARAAILYIAVFAVYCVYGIKDIVHVAQIATQGEGFSYGARILPAHLYHQVGADRWAGPAALKQLLAVIPRACLALAIVLRVRRHLVPRRNEKTPATAALLEASRWGAPFISYVRDGEQLRLPARVSPPHVATARRVGRSAGAPAVIIEYDDTAGDHCAPLDRQLVANIGFVGRARELGGSRHADRGPRRHHAAPCHGPRCWSAGVARWRAREWYVAAYRARCQRAVRPANG
jgi:hypothetical protein